MGWKIAWARGLGANRPAQKLDLRIAMQQLLDRAPWLERLRTRSSKLACERRMTKRARLGELS